jgi:hypothetical protein
MPTPPLDADLLAALASAEAPGEEPKDFGPVRRVDRSLFTPKMKAGGYCVIPVWVMKELVKVRAHHAIALVAIILQRIRTKGIDPAPITASMWNAIGLSGTSNKWGRQIALQQLRRVPGILRLEERHARTTRYQAALGDLWDETGGNCRSESGAAKSRSLRLSQRIMPGEAGIT